MPVELIMYLFGALVFLLCATIYRRMTTMIVGRSRCLNVRGTNVL